MNFNVKVRKKKGKYISDQGYMLINLLCKIFFYCSKMQF